jgi:aspartyl-tRNA(Asn)/glutamyl-tRNA(Gln) amidotransferase subunit A
MSRTVRDSAMLLQVLAGHDDRDRGSLRDEPDDYLVAADRGVDGFRIAWSPDFGYAPVDDEVARTTATAAKAFEDMGATVEETDLNVGQPFDAFWDLFSTIALVRAGTLPEEHHDELTWYGKETYERGAGVSGRRFALAFGEIDVLKAKFSDLFSRYDLLLSPTLATTAFPVGSPPETIGGKPVHWFWGYLPFTYPINMIGHPAASVPCGFSSGGLPIGLHIVGRRGDESSVIAASAAFEEAHPWAHHRPAVS